MQVESKGSAAAAASIFFGPERGTPDGGGLRAVLPETELRNNLPLPPFCLDASGTLLRRAGFPHMAKLHSQRDRIQIDHVAHGKSPTETNKDYAIGLARAFGGAILFAIPLLMTMEMWWLGFSMERGRLLLFMAVNFAVLTGLSYFAGFEKTFSWKEDVMDALAAFSVGMITSAFMLTLLAVVTFDMTWNEIVGKIALQSVPASIGAMLGRKQLGADQDTQAEEERKEKAGYGGELFLMLAGALFLAFNVAPTEEMVLIAFQMTPWHSLALGAVSIVLLHLFVYTVGFSGQESRPEGGTFLSTFFHFTLAGYGIALLVSFYSLWTFGRTAGVAPAEVANMVMVLGFPATLGAATARLVI